MEALESVNDLILGLYRYGRDVPIADFRTWAFDRLREVIGFDSAVWGTNSESPQKVHSASLYGLPRAVVDDYVRDGWQARDCVRAACVANPGVAINLSDLMSPSRWHRTQLYRRFARPHGLEWVLSNCQVDSVAPLHEFISLARSDGERPFSETDRRRLQVLVPHLTEAMRANHLWHFSAMAVPRESQAAKGMGLCDREGFMHDCSRTFSRLIRSEWPGWTGVKLPAMLVASFAAGAFSGKRVDVTAEPLGDQWLLRIDAGGAAKQLGARERQVAALYARGLSYRDIARAVGVAPATVRNQLRASFRKLGVTSKLELARRLADSGAGSLQ